MIVDKYGRVAGSIDLAVLAGMYAECDDDDLRDHYRQVAAENGFELGSGVADEPDDEPELEPEPEDAAPPRAGAGSGREVWVAYAESRGVEVDDDMSRDEIVAAVEEASDGNDDVS